LSLSFFLREKEMGNHTVKSRFDGFTPKDFRGTERSFLISDSSSPCI